MKKKPDLKIIVRRHLAAAPPEDGLPERLRLAPLGVVRLVLCLAGGGVNKNKGAMGGEGTHFNFKGGRQGTK